MSKDIDQVASSVAETTSPTGTERIYVGVNSGVPNVSIDGWLTVASVFNYPVPVNLNVLASNVTAYTVTNADVNGIIESTGTAVTTITIPGNLTKLGSIGFSKGGTGNLTIVGTGGLVLDGTLRTITTQYNVLGTVMPWPTMAHMRPLGFQT